MAKLHSNQRVRQQLYDHVYNFYLERLIVEGVKVRGVPK